MWIQAAFLFIKAESGISPAEFEKKSSKSALKSFDSQVQK